MKYRGLFFFNDTATTEIYTLSLHDALPISSTPAPPPRWPRCGSPHARLTAACSSGSPWPTSSPASCPRRSEEHTSELQSRQYLVCRLLLEKKKMHSGLTPCIILLEHIVLRG